MSATDAEIENSSAAEKVNPPLNVRSEMINIGSEPISSAHKYKTLDEYEKASINKIEKEYASEVIKERYKEDIPKVSGGSFDSNRELSRDFKDEDLKFDRKNTVLKHASLVRYKETVQVKDDLLDLPKNEILDSSNENAKQKIEPSSSESDLEILETFKNLKSKQEIIQYALKVTYDRIKCQTAAIFIISPKDRLLERVGIYGASSTGKIIEEDWLKEENYEVDESFTGASAVPSQNSGYGEAKVYSNLDNEYLKYRSQYLGKFGTLKCAMSLPLDGRNKTYGVLRIINKIGEDNSFSDFSDNDFAWLTFLAGATAAALSNIYRDTRESVLRYAKNALINSNLIDFDYSRFFSTILEFLTSSETAFKVAILRVRDSKEMKLRYVSASDGKITKRDDNKPRRFDQGFVGLAVESGKPQIIEKITESGLADKFINSNWVKENKFESFACFPFSIPGIDGVTVTLSLFTGYEYEFHPRSIEFLNDLISSVALLVQKEEKKDKIRKKFAELIKIWKKEAIPLSSNSKASIHPAYQQIDKAIIHPAYQQIIGMGEDIVPLLLNQLDDASDHWFWALESITGENPVPIDNRRKTKRMARAWMDWGKKKGYIKETKRVDKENSRKRKSWQDLAGIAPKKTNSEDAQEWLNRERSGWSKREERILLDR
jgi:hypothetical protein